MAASHRGGSGQTRQQTSSTDSQTTVAQAPRQAVLRLRGATRQQERENEVVDESEGSASGGRASRRIQWAEDVVDNEGLGRKKSKVCCIYHAPKAFGESSDESSSDSDDSDSADDGAARPTRGVGHGHHGHNHGHDHGKAGKGKGRASSPNAYEKMPKTTKKAVPK